MIVYCESRKRELKTRPLYECRCYERLKTKTEKSTHLTYTGFLGEMENLNRCVDDSRERKIKKREKRNLRRTEAHVEYSRLETFGRSRRWNTKRSCNRSRRWNTKRIRSRLLPGQGVSTMKVLYIKKSSLLDQMRNTSHLKKTGFSSHRPHIWETNRCCSS
jgi:hypothetical protein